MQVKRQNKVSFKDASYRASYWVRIVSLMNWTTGKSNKQAINIMKSTLESLILISFRKREEMLYCPT